MIVAKQGRRRQIIGDHHVCLQGAWRGKCKMAHFHLTTYLKVAKLQRTQEEIRVVAIGETRAISLSISAVNVSRSSSTRLNCR